jgi:CRP/FNR family transcriptional regulator, nitrogen oxide reductase regulator
MNPAPRRSSLARGALFMELDGHTAEILLNAATQRQFASGTTLFHQGDAPCQLFQISTGLVRLTRVNPEGEQTTLRFMGAGDLVGCVAVFRQVPFPATATASRPTNVLSWGSAQILDLISHHPAISVNALNTVGDRAREMVDRLAEMTDKGTEARVASVLLRLVVQVGWRASATSRSAVSSAAGRGRASCGSAGAGSLSSILSGWRRSPVEA